MRIDEGDATGDVVHSSDAIDGWLPGEETVFVMSTSRSGGRVTDNWLSVGPT